MKVFKPKLSNKNENLRKLFVEIHFTRGKSKFSARVFPLIVEIFLDRKTSWRFTWKCLHETLEATAKTDDVLFNFHLNYFHVPYSTFPKPEARRGKRNKNLQILIYFSNLDNALLCFCLYLQSLGREAKK